MAPVSLENRKEISNRLMGGQPPKLIAADMKVALKTVYRLKARFEQEDGTFEAVEADVADKRAFKREELIEINQWLIAEPKLTLKAERN